jgi:hypothetical protein
MFYTAIMVSQFVRLTQGASRDSAWPDGRVNNHGLPATPYPLTIMTNQRFLWATACAALLGLAGCASRPINTPITQVDPNGGYTFQTRQKHFKNQDTLVVLAFSGGGTRAAAFSYGVLEFLRRTEVVAANGAKLRLIDAVDMITGVSGGSFTALAYGLYGNNLFADYEQRPRR